MPHTFFWSDVFIHCLFIIYPPTDSNAAEPNV
jgi:hypothetical protein